MILKKYDNFIENRFQNETAKADTTNDSEVVTKLREIKRVLLMEDKTIKDIQDIEPLVDFVEENETDEILKSELFLEVIEIMEKEENLHLSDSLFDEVLADD